MIVNKKNEIEVLKDIQKNTEKAMKAIDVISSKVYDDDLALQLSRQALKYSDIHNKAVDMILEERAMPYAVNNVQDIMLSGSIHLNTVLNNSTSHVAQLVIRETHHELTDMWKSVNHHVEVGSKSMEIAKELMDFEEKNIEILKKYL
ncbi:MAG: hypothetical protein PHE02_11790 [Lachnospiraceae bacterium]|nr:hypothetical protein [Lachnospiraceae bacterium]